MVFREGEGVATAGAFAFDFEADTTGSVFTRLGVLAVSASSP